MKFGERYYTAIAVSDVAPVIRRFGDQVAKGVLRVPRDMVGPIQKELVRLRCQGVKVLPNDRTTSATPDDYHDQAVATRREINKKKHEQRMIAEDDRMRKSR
jgi:hypothetical protein